MEELHAHAARVLLYLLLLRQAEFERERVEAPVVKVPVGRGQYAPHVAQAHRLREGAVVEHDAHVLAHLRSALLRVGAQHPGLAAVRFARPSSRRIVVLLPAPFSPISPMMQPVGSVKLTLLSEKPLYLFVRPFTSIAFCILISLAGEAEHLVQLFVGKAALVGQLLCPAEKLFNLPQVLLPYQVKIFPSNEAALSGVGHKEPVALKLLVGPLRRNYAYPQLLGQKADGRKGVPLLELARVILPFI